MAASGWIVTNDDNTITEKHKITTLYHS